MTRIGFADHLFLRMHHGIGNPVFNQFLWWFDDSISGDELEKFRLNLSSGLLSRKVEAPTLPTARHRWIASAVSLPYDRSEVPIDPSTVRCWAEQRIVDELDPELGIGWQLSSVPLAGGGTVVSLVCSHMVADGAAMLAAVRRANTDDENNSRELGDRPSFAVGLLDDLTDTVGQLGPILKWAGSTVLGAAGSLVSGGSVVSGGQKPAPTGPQSTARASSPARRRPASTNSGPWSPPYVVAECSAASWHAAAAEWGGTSNSLFIAVMTAVSEELGRAVPGDELRWSLPFNDRAADAIDANSTKIIPVVVPVSDRDDRDLTRIRKASKTAFTEFAARQAAGTRSEAIPLPLVQMLPDAVVAKLPRPADGAEGLCSNLGPLPDDFTTIGGVRARSVAARATFAGADADFGRSLGGGSTAWATETEKSVTVSLHGMDPDRIATDDDMRTAVATVLERWAIVHRFW